MAVTQTHRFLRSTMAILNSFTGCQPDLIKAENYVESVLPSWIRHLLKFSLIFLPKGRERRTGTCQIWTRYWNHLRYLFTAISNQFSLLGLRAALRCWRTAALKFVSEIKLFAATLATGSGCLPILGWTQSDMENLTQNLLVWKGLDLGMHNPKIAIHVVMVENCW